MLHNSATTLKGTSKVSICVTVKNRSRVVVGKHELLLFPNCVTSIAQSVPSDIDCELVVADWESDDWPVAEWLPQQIGRLPLTLLTLSGSFSRGRGCNVAAASATGDCVFFLDADCLISEKVLREAWEVANAGKAYFPVVYSFDDPGHHSGRWRPKGFGNCALPHGLFHASGGFPEYDFWGREDVHFYETVSHLHPVVRKRVHGFYHQWHPDDFAWKNRYGKPSPFEELKRRRNKEDTNLALAEIADLRVSEGAFILIDDGLLGPHLPNADRVRSLLERDGQLWGLPADSSEAIVRLEQLRSEGTFIIVIAWVSFWWFEHYPGFYEHLCSRYKTLFDGERLVIFDLRA